MTTRQIGAEFTRTTSGSSSDLVQMLHYNSTLGQWENQTITVANLFAGGSDTPNINVGASGTAGTLKIFPTTASKGDLKLVATDNTGNTETTVTNASQAAARTYTIPDAGASASFVMTAGSQTITGTKTIAALVTTDIDVGASGTAGSVDVFPTTASKGKITITATANTNNDAISITNAAFGQASTLTIPDVGSATGAFVMDKYANVLTATNQINTLKIGASGTIGAFNVYPTTASKGSVRVLAADSAGDTVTTITNASMGQAITFTLPDPAASTANIVVTTTANGTEASNAVTASGYTGVITTSALTAAAGASYAITWTNTKVTSSSKIILTKAGGTNTRKNFQTEVVSGSSSATLTLYNTEPTNALNGTVILNYLVIP